MTQGADQSVGGDKGRPGEREELAAWLASSQQLMNVGVTLIRLFGAELRLSIDSARRLLFMSLLFLPLALLTWLGFSILLSWVAYRTVESALASDLAMGAAVFVFFLQQMILLGIVGWRVVVYRRHLGFAVTRKHWQSFREGMRSGLRPTDQ